MIASEGQRPGEARAGEDSGIARGRVRGGGAARCLAAGLPFVLAAAACVVYFNTLAPNTRTFWNLSFYNQAQRIEREAEETAPGARGNYLLVFGASLTCLNVVPPVFEEALREAGLEMRVYNLGIPGAHLHEVDHYLRKTLAGLEARGVPMPRYVAIDLTLPFKGFVPEEERGSIRSIEWHTLRETLSAIESLRRNPAPLRQRLPMLGIHVGELARNYLPVGRVHHLLSDPVADEKNFFSGFHVFPEEAAPIDPAVFASLIDDKIRRLGGSPDTRHYNIPAARDQMRFLMERGILPVFFLPPSFGDSSMVYALEREGVVPKLFAFDDPRLFPELWRVEDRQDTHHLKSGEPSERFTKALAASLVEGVLRNPEYPGLCRRAVDAAEDAGRGRDGSQ